jgi:iron(III) transport system permease protein
VTTWRLTLTILLWSLLGTPLLFPLVQLGRQPAAWDAWQNPARLGELTENTLLLVGGTLAIAVPLGIFLAALLERSDLPFRRQFRFLMILMLLVPLPLYASAWQATLGAGGWLAATSGEWRPWAQGMVPAIWVHALAALPWIVLLVGQGLCWVERELEEDALTAASPWRVFWRFTLPRARAAVAAAILWIAVQTAAEITVTDLMLVRTFAEEVYTQFTLQNPDDLPRAVAVSLPTSGLAALLVLWAAQRWRKTLPPLEQAAEPLCLFHLGKARWPVCWLVIALIALLVGVPLIGLLWKAGLGGSPEHWSGDRLSHLLLSSLTGKWRLVAENMTVALAAGVIAAGLALTACWLSSESRWFQASVLLLAALAWTIPGPVVGIGLKSTINELLNIEEAITHSLGLSVAQAPLRLALWDGPSPLPVLWVSVIRFFPFALAVLWPAVRLLPVEQRDAARLDGAHPWDELRRVIFPLTKSVCFRAALAVAVLSLGELSAGKLVETPGWTTLAHVIFEQMHRGVPADVASLCLVLLLQIVLGGALVAALMRRSPTE